MKARWAWLLVFSLFTSSLGLSLVSGTSGANAQEPTVTPTATPTPTDYWTSIWDTPTPLPTRRYECCEGTPEGWGLCTPAAVWMMNCAHCIPVPTSALLPPYTPFPTNTPWPVVTVTPTLTGTPPVSGTVTPTPEVTPTPTPLPSIWEGPIFADCGSGGFTVESDGLVVHESRAGCWVDRSLANSIRWYWDDATRPYCPFESVHVKIHVYGNGGYDNSGTNDPFRIGFQLFGNDFNGGCSYNYSALIGGTGNIYPSAQGVPIMVDTYVEADIDLTNWCLDVNEPATLVVYRYASDTTLCDADYYWEIVEFEVDGASWLPETPTPTPTPTPTVTPTPTITPTVTSTPVSDTYCCTVECEDPAGGNDWGMLPNIQIGLGDCVTIDPYDLSAIGLGQFPGVEFCAVPLRFGDVNIIGVTLSIDVLATVAAALVALRLVWRS